MLHEARHWQAHIQYAVSSMLSTTRVSRMLFHACSCLAEHDNCAPMMPSCRCHCPLTMPYATQSDALTRLAMQVGKQMELLSLLCTTTRALLRGAP
jgi:hypothetical protein